MDIQNLRTWWSDDGEWFCMEVSSAGSSVTLSLTPKEAFELAKRSSRLRVVQGGKAGGVDAHGDKPQVSFKKTEDAPAYDSNAPLVIDWDAVQGLDKPRDG